MDSWSRANEFTQKNIGKISRSQQTQHICVDIYLHVLYLGRLTSCRQTITFLCKRIQIHKINNAKGICNQEFQCIIGIQITSELTERLGTAMFRRRSFVSY